MVGQVVHHGGGRPAPDCLARLADNWFDNLMGLLDKTNPTATWQSVTRHAIIGAVLSPALFLAFGKPAVREHWCALLPVFAILGAAVAAILEWQLDDNPDESDDEDWGEGFDPE
ncbi:MAG TPA: hypothetical protein VJ783_22440 [Pirellulales bacterium]|nr:hypothetical protein [Pirellulales bacterium]